MELHGASDFSIFTFNTASDLKFGTGSYNSGFKVRMEK